LELPELGEDEVQACLHFFVRVKCPSGDFASRMNRLAS